MSPSNDSDDGTQPKFVVCASCGSKAQPSWSFCRSCNSSLDDAVPADEARDDIRTADAPDLGPTGCPKCGHDDAEVAQIATTGAGITAWFDLQNHQFRAVSCTNCGYTEFYRGSDPDVIVDLFLG